MDPTIDVENGVPPGVAAFYDWLAPEYNTMTGFAKLFVHEKPFFRMLVERHGIRTAVDAGCGTGFHSLLLAQLGVSVTAVDVSADMLAGVQRHAGDLPIHPLRSSFRDLPSAV